jgi:hypothetical protein
VPRFYFTLIAVSTAFKPVTTPKILGWVPEPRADRWGQVVVSQRFIAFITGQR